MTGQLTLAIFSWVGAMIISKSWYIKLITTPRNAVAWSRNVNWCLAEG